MKKPSTLNTMQSSCCGCAGDRNGEVARLLSTILHRLHLLLEPLPNPRLPIVELLETFIDACFLARAERFGCEVINAGFEAFLCQAAELLKESTTISIFDREESVGKKAYHDCHVQCLAFHAALELLLFRWGETGELLVSCLQH
jgi:hypothetical protein